MDRTKHAMNNQDDLSSALSIQDVTQASKVHGTVSHNDTEPVNLSECTVVRKNISKSSEVGASKSSGKVLSGDDTETSTELPWSGLEDEFENPNHGLVDTDTAYESVKEAVSKYGGITDWKAHRARVWERRRSVQQELEKIRQDIPRYKKQTESAEDAKAQVLKELEETNTIIEELKLSLEKSIMEEEQVKQDAILAEMRVKEMEQGIAGETSVAFKVQIDVAKARHAAAIAELESVKSKLEALKEEKASRIYERDDAIKTAEAAARTSKDTEKAVEDLTLELIIAREALESAHSAHMEAEENRITVASSKDQNVLNLEEDLKEAEDELNQLNEKILYVKDLRSKLQSASALLLNLKGELAAYMEAKLNQESQDTMETPKEVFETHTGAEEAIASIKKEIEELQTKIERVKEEVKILRVAAASLQSELETEKEALSNMKEREEPAYIAVSSLEAELKRTKEELEVVFMKEKVAKDQLLDLPEALQQATLEADQAKSAALLAHETLKKVKEEAEQIKDSANIIQCRLDAALKEIEAAKASESLAMTAVRALHDSGQDTALGHDNDDGVTISFVEYYKLSRRAREAEELAKERVAAALSEIEAAKASESSCLEKLEEMWRELEEKKQVMRSAVDKAEDAKHGKLEIEQELRMRRAESERHQKAVESPPQDAANNIGSPRMKSEGRRRSKSAAAVLEEEDPTPNFTSPESGMTVCSPQTDKDNASPILKTKKKKSLFPRIALFLSRKK